MQNRFQKNITAHFPELLQANTLLAVSGGLDSVAMVHLFATAGLSFGIAHCNFQLRGIDSDEDEALVRALAVKHQVPYHTIAFDTNEAVASNNDSLQMTARRLRYEWFETIRQKHTYHFIATAHHLNDSIETSLINQIRGTGMRGLQGIPIRNGAIVRPLHQFTRPELEIYVRENQLHYREDSSNQKDDYHRNQIRHHVIPVLQSINPAFEQSFRSNLNIWSESNYLVQWACEQLHAKYVRKKDSQWQIDSSFIKDHPEAAPTLLYEWVKIFGFHPHQLQQAIAAVDHKTGLIWNSATHQLLLNRGDFWINPIQQEIVEKSYIVENIHTVVAVGSQYLSLSIQEERLDPTRSPSDWVAYLDADRVDFPLSVRHWQAGDTFFPLGMDGHRKKLQDYFTDKKITRFDKEKIWIILDANQDIVWIIGHRIDDRFKIRKATEKTLIIRFD